MKPIRRFQIALFLGALLVCRIATAQTYSIDWYSIDGGGGTSSGGGFELTGTIGQPDAGKLTGGGFELTGGFLSVVMALQTDGAPELGLRTGDAGLILFWASPAEGFHLEFTDRLESNAAWTTVEHESNVVEGLVEVPVASAPGNRFFRLRKP